MTDSLRILLIDDDANDRALARSVLLHQLPNSSIVAVKDALSFADEFANEQFDVAVCEWSLDWACGLEIIRSIKRRNPQCATVLFTRAELGLGESGPEGEADAYVHKSSAGFVQLPSAIERAQHSLTHGSSPRLDPEWDQRLWDQLPVGVFTLSPNGEFLRANPALASLLGFPDPRQVSGRQLPDLLTDREARVSLRRQLEHADSCEAVDLEIRSNDGTVTVRRLSLWPLGVVGTSQRRFQGILTDPLAVPALERAEDEEFNLLATTLFHELQDPLQLLGQYAQILDDRFAAKRDPSAAELLVRIGDITRRLTGMVRGMTDYLGSRHETLHPFTDVNLAHALAEALAQLGDLIEDTGAQVVAEQLPTIAGDPKELTQLFRRLVENALKFRSDAPPRVEITAEERANDWLLRVKDNGIGIRPESAERIFEMFERLHDPDAYPGPGVGLAICRRIAEQHGGDIWVRAEPDAGAEPDGATFVVTLSKHLRQPRRSTDGSSAGNGAGNGTLGNLTAQ